MLHVVQPSNHSQAFVNGVSFWKAGSSPQAVQNQVFSLFLLTSLFGCHVQLIMKRFHESRTLYLIRERQSRTYSWVVFLTSNILVELLSQTIVSIIAFVCWYYPLGMWQNALHHGELSQRGGLTFLFIWSLMILVQTMSQMLMTIMPDIPTGINIGNLLFMLAQLFSGYVALPCSSANWHGTVWAAMLTSPVSLCLRMRCRGSGSSCIVPRPCPISSRASCPSVSLARKSDVTQKTL